MSKRSVLFLCILFIATNAFSQRLMHSLGSTISVTTAKIKSGSYTNKFLLTHTDLTYFPRFNLTESENSSFSIGVPLSAGISVLNDTYSDGSGIYWGFDVPVVADYNFGAKSTQDNEEKFGGYVGAGFGYSFTNFTFDGTDNNNANSYGPLVRAGARFGFPALESGQGMTIGLFYKIGLETQKFKTFGFNVLLDF